jgi:hypothetical protein
MRTAIVLLTLSLVSLSAFAADGPVKGIPLEYKWQVSACQNWNCAASALVSAGGDPYVIALPTNSSQYSWIVVRRVLGGSFFYPDDAPFRVETYEDAGMGVSRYTSLDHTFAPLSITTPDRRMLVIYLNAPEPAKPRAVTH